MADRKLIVEIVGDDSSLQRAFGRTERSVKRFNVGIGTLVKSAVVFRAANEAMTGLASAVRGSISEFASQQKVAAQTNAVIASTGGIANVSAAQVDKLANSIQSYSGIDDEAVKSGANLLLTFKNIRNEVGKGNAIFDRATRAAVDLSVAGFGSLESTSKTLGKALNDPVKGMTALGRAGVTFSDGQKETIKRLVETGKTLDAQKIILQEVTSQVGGSAKAFGETIPGALARTSEAFKNMGGAIVGAVAPAFADFADLVADQLPKIEAGVSAFVDRFKEAKTVTAKIEVVLQTVGDLSAKAGKIARDILNSIAEQLAKIDWRIVGERIGEGLTSALDAIAEFVRSVDWAVVGAAVVRGIADFLKGVDWVKVFKSIVLLWVAALKASANILAGAADELGRQLADALTEALERATIVVEKAVLKLVIKVLGAFGFLGRFNPFKGVVDKAKAALEDLEIRTAQFGEIAERAAVGTHGKGTTQAERDAAKTASAKASAAQKVARDAQVKANAETDKADKAQLQKEADAAKAKAKKLKDQADELARKQIEDEKKRRQAVIAARKAAQFEALGLTGEGETRTPGSGSLLKRARSLQAQIKGTSLDTDKTREQLRRIISVLKKNFKTAGKDVRNAILEMLNDISQALEGKGPGAKKGPLTSTHGLATAQIIKNLGLTVEQAEEIQRRLAHATTGGGISRGIGGGTATLPRSGFGQMPVVVESHTNLYMDRQLVASIVTKEQQRTKRRNPKQKRGPNRR